MAFPQENPTHTAMRVKLDLLVNKRELYVPEMSLYEVAIDDIGNCSPNISVMFTKSLLTIIQGIDLFQTLQLHIDQLERIELLTHQGTRLYIDSNNQFCDELICSLQKEPEEPKIFQLLNKSNALKCLNLFLVMNGYECVVTRSKLKLIFGRFHYSRHGRVRGVREFLKEYFRAPCKT